MMMMTSGARLLRAASVLAVAALGACNQVQSYPTPVLRQADGAPGRFVRGDGTSLTRPSLGAAACPSPLKDPLGGTQLLLVRAYVGRGDYSLPQGTYGVGVGELLRVDCADGSPLGIVRG